MECWVVQLSDAGMHFEFSVNHGGQNVITASLTRLLRTHPEETLRLLKTTSGNDE